MRLLLSAAILTLAAACAPQPAGPPTTTSVAAGEAGQCFHSRDVNGFHEPTRRTVDLDVSTGEVFRLELFGLCPQLQDAYGLGVQTLGGSDYVCSRNDVQLIVPTMGGPRSCPVRSMRRLAAAEAEASRATKR